MTPRSEPPDSTSPPSVEDVLSLQREVVAELMRSDALVRGDVDEALRLVTEAAARLLDVRRASVWRFDDSRTRIQCLDLYDAVTNQHSRGLALEQRDAPAYFQAALGERCIVADDARSDPRTREFKDSYLVPHGITSMLDAPVLVRGTLVGVMCHEHVGSARSWHAREELLAGTLADFVGMALSAAEHAMQARELGILRDGLEELVAERTRELQQSRENVRALFEASPVAMVLVRVADDRVILANRRAASLFLLSPEQVRGQHSPEFWVDLDERAELLAAVRDRGFVESFDSRLKRADGTPFWGSLAVQSLRFESEPCLLVTILDITEKKELEKRLRTLATTDGLTGIFNRRHFFEIALPLVQLAERHGRPLAVAMIDVDHFKAINDQHGHAVGDEALRTLARVCQQELRVSDVLARYGGEELVVLFPESDHEAASAAVERIRAALRHAAVPTADAPIRLKVSAGVAGRNEGEGLDDLLRRADEALYAAKRAGRDRVVTSP